MKKLFLALAMVLLAFCSFEILAQNTTVTISATGAATWQVPAGVTTITVECWGAGGGGGNSNNGTGNGGGGGGGGAYSRKVFTGLVPLTTYNVFVGAGGTGGQPGAGAAAQPGADTWFVDNTTSLAKGGSPGIGAGNGGTGGLSGTSIGDVVFAGGNGGNSGGTGGAGGGSSAGTAAIGANGTNGSGTAGGTAPAGGGNGGAGSTTTTGTAGTVPGGGGGGGDDDTADSGGAGANGRIVITYDTPGTYYSRGTGDWHTLGTWSTTSHTVTAAPAFLPGVNDVVLIGDNDVVTIQSNSAAITISTLTVDDGVTGTGTITYGSTNNTATNLTVSGNFVVGTNGVVQVGGNNGATHTLTIGGPASSNFTNNGSFNLIGGSGDVVNVIFTGAGTKTIAGSSTTTTFNNVTVNGPVTYGNNANVRTLAINTLTVSSTLQSGSTAAIAHTIQVSGGLSNNGTIDLTLNSATNQTLSFSATGSIFGSAATTNLYNLTVTGGTRTFGDGANARTINIANDFTVNVGATFQSGSTGALLHTINLSRNLTNSGTINLTAGSATNHVLTSVGNGSILGSAAAVTTLYNFAVTSGTRTFGDNANSRTFGIANDLTISVGAILQSGNTGANLHTINLSGNLTNNGTLDLTVNNPTLQQLSFDGNVLKNISGSGVFTLSTLVLNKTGVNVNIDATTNVSVNSNITFNTNCLLIVGSTSNVVLSSTATISGASSNRYIQLDGASGSNSSLIRTSDNTTVPWDFIFQIGTSTGGYTPVDIQTISTAPDNGSTLAIKPIINADLDGRLKRVFQFIIAGNTTGTTFSTGVFSYNDATDISAGDVETDYTVAWRFESSWAVVPSSVNTTSNTFTVTGGTPTTATLNSGTYYYTMGSPISTIWYSYQTGVYSDFNTWTLDPSGTTFDNGLEEIPSAGDEIRILNGFTVTVDLASLNLSASTIDAGGILDMAATAGHSLGIVTGTGLLKVMGTALPTATYTDFVSTSGGTIEYYDVTGNLPTAQTTYNKLKMTNSTGANVNFVLVSNMTVNGTFDLSTTGAGTVTWQINDATAAQRTITLNGDLTLASGGRITVGTGNEGSTAPHALTMLGNITNNGIIKFYDPLEESDELPVASYGNTGATPNIYTNELQGNAVTVTFSGTVDKTVTCNNTTDFYRLVLNKGTGQQAVLTVNSTNTSFFRLFGPNDFEPTGTAPNQISPNNLSLVNGTLKLTGLINIPNLNVDFCTGAFCFLVTEFYPIPQTAGLWLNGAGVTVTVADNSAGNSDQRLYVDGLLKVSSGILNTGFSKGIGSGQAGSMVIEGGTVNTWQFRPYALGTGIFAYTQSGGTFNVGYGYALSGGTIDTYTEDYARFDLTSPNSSFSVSGGILNVAKATDTGGFIIGSASGNYNVTGGTFNFYTGNEEAADDDTFVINTTAPIFNLSINRESGASIAQLVTNNLIVSNNLTLVDGAADPTFNCNNLNLTVGGNFDVQTGATLTPGTNTITFNGTSTQTWTHNGTISGLNNVTVNKTGTLTLAGGGTFPSIAGATTGLTLTSGTLADGGKTLTVTGAISNSATHSGAGSIVVNGATSIGGNNGTFGNLTIETNNTVATSGIQTVTGTLRLINANTTLNIGANALNALGNIYSDAATGVAFTATKRILTNGFHNSGGLTRQGAAGNVLFPVGAGALYTPNTINVTATTHGTITVRPVNSEHPNVTTTAQAIRYYWRVTSAGYVDITTVTHTGYDYSTAIEDNPTANYRTARFDAGTLTWGTNNTTFDATISPPIPTFNTGTGWAGVTGDQLDGEYTCGNVAAFGNVTTYYSKVSGAWNATTTWSNVGHAGADVTIAPPCATCPVVIGDGAGINHTITTVANSSCGTLALNSGSTLDASTFTHNFGTSTGGSVTGRGRLRINSANFPTGDFINFLGSSGGTVEWYGGAKTIPSTYVGPGAVVINLTSYYNLTISPNAGVDINMPATSLTIYNDFTVSGPGLTARAVTNVAAPRTLTINDDLIVTGGTLSLANNAAVNSTSFVIADSIAISSGAAITIQTTNDATHTIQTSGSIINNGGLDLYGGVTTRVANVTFTGSSDVNFSGTNGLGADLSFVTVNKGTSQTPTVNFSMGGTVTATNNNPTPWLTLTNGTFSFNNSGTYDLINVAAGAIDFVIPPTAKLRVNAGTVNVLTDNNDGADLMLNGALEVSGGAANVGDAANDNHNDIEYASAGTPSITVSNGTLYVNGSIRRSTSTITGALVYNQTGGTVTVGGRNADQTNTRGVFEIDANTGSNFTLTGTATLNVQRQTGGAGYADVFINPLTSSVSSTSTITVGLTGAASVVQANLRINIDPSIGNFTIQDGNGASAQTVRLFSNPLVLGGNLVIPAPSVLITNNLDVSIAGNMTGTGTYTGGTNTTTFNGTAAQAAALSATSTFNNVTISKTGGTTLSLSGTSPTLNNLNILTGILDVGALALDVRRDITINSSQVGAGSILIFSTTANSNTITSSGGSFTNLTLGGSATSKTVGVTGNLTINGTLNFSVADRYLVIGSSNLTFGSSASAVSGAGSNRFIRTNGVSSDLGVTKIWGVGTNTFVYAVGTSTNYTPVSFSLNVTTGGNLTVTPVNSAHVTYNQASTEQILNYYWNVSKSGTLAATATANHTYSYPSALITGTGGALVAGYLPVSNPVGWVTSGHGGSATTTQMDFTNAFPTNIPGAGFAYDYSVGTINTLPNPIVPLYSRLGVPGIANPNIGGNWTTAANWTTDTDGDMDLNNPSSVIPNGVPVVILAGARINTTTNGKKAFRITINGLLHNGTRTGHNFGIIEGTGTFRTATNTFPAGDYTAFVSSAGGTIEYVAPMTMNSRTTYNNLSIFPSTPGTVTMTASNLTINGDVTIPATTTLDNSTNNASITILGDWVNNGAFVSGSGAATVTFNGTAAQSTTGTNTFNNLTMNNPNDNLTLGNTTTVNGVLNMTSGNIISNTFPTAPIFILGASATLSGGSASSFVSGQIRKTMNNATTFTFPTGSDGASRYRPVTISSTNAVDTWDVSYIPTNPTGDGFPNATFNAANLMEVSAFEYWQVANGTGTTTAGMTLSFGPGSYTTGMDAGILDSLKIARWDGAQWDIPPGGGSFSQTGTNLAGTVSVSFQNAFSPQTIATTDINAALPIELNYFKGDVVGASVVLKWETEKERNNDFFTVERSSGGEVFSVVGKVNGSGTTNHDQTYSLIDTNPLYGWSYYRLKQTDFDGTYTYSRVISINYEGPVSAVLNVYPNPSKGDRVTIEVLGLKNVESIPVTIYDQLGREMMKVTLEVDENMGSAFKELIFENELPSGMYLVKAGTSGYLFNRLVVSRK